MSKEVTYMQCWFEGHVQGVGFRYATMQVAKEFEVTGQVENLPDGRVYLQAEGQDKEVHAFQAEIADRMESFIRNCEVKTTVRQAQFNSFSIAG